ncbi:MAG: NAD-binding protein, partial [Rhodanobacteraceae bacterium]
IAPRGIVAAAVSALFALKLQELGVPGAERLVPLVFILIIATVIVQSATSRSLAKLLGVAAPDPDGVLVFGANIVARTVAAALAEQGVKVLVADDDWNGIRRARMQGLSTYFGNPASQHADRLLDLDGIGRLLAMSTHREMNTLACVHYREEFGRGRVYRLRNLDPAESSERAALAGPLLAPPLFADDMTNPRFTELLDQGWRVKSTALTDAFGWSQFVEQHGADACVLFALNDKGVLRIVSTKRELDPRPGWTVTALVSPQTQQTS